MVALTQFPNISLANKWHAGVRKPNRRRPALGVFDKQTSGGTRAADLLDLVSPKVFSEQINPQIEQHVLYGRRQALGDKFLVPMDPAQFSGIRFSRARRVANSSSSSGAESLRVCIHLVPPEKSLVVRLSACSSCRMELQFSGVVPPCTQIRLEWGVESAPVVDIRYELKYWSLRGSLDAHWLSTSLARLQTFSKYAYAKNIKAVATKINKGL